MLPTVVTVDSDLFRMKKRNVTLTLDEDTARWARVEAARLDVSVSRFLGDMLEGRMKESRGYSAARRRYLAREPVLLKKGDGYPTRDEIHGRQ